jgi:hypothetical protein
MAEALRDPRVAPRVAEAVRDRVRCANHPFDLSAQLRGKVGSDSQIPLAYGEIDSHHSGDQSHEVPTKRFHRLDGLQVCDPDDGVRAGARTMDIQSKPTGERRDRFFHNDCSLFAGDIHDS